MASGRPPLDEAKRLAITMLAVDGEQQADIAKHFAITQSTVSRVLAEAERKRWLQRSVSIDPREIHPDLLRRAKAFVARPPRLQEHIAELVAEGQLPHEVSVRIFSCTEPRNTELNYERRTELFGLGAARYVLELLSGGVRTCGLTWGHSIGAVVSGIETVSTSSSRTAKLVEVVPLCGDPLGRDVASLFSSSVLAERLCRAVNGKITHNLSLTMLPAFLPGDFSAGEVNTVWKLIAKMHAYTAIFGGRETRNTAGASTAVADGYYANRLDMILTGISPAGRPMGDGHGPLFESGGLKQEKFKELVLADIGGVLIENGKLSRGQKATLSRLKSRWTGLNERELRGCAERAAVSKGNPQAPGVVVIAVGRAKGEPLMAALALGLVNQLLIDAELEEDLLRRLG